MFRAACHQLSLPLCFTTIDYADKNQLAQAASVLKLAASSQQQPTVTATEDMLIHAHQSVLSIIHSDQNPQRINTDEMKFGYA